MSYWELILAAFVLMLPFLYESSPIFRYYVKFFAYYIVVSANSLILIPVFSLRARDVRNLIKFILFTIWLSAVFAMVIPVFAFRPKNVRNTITASYFCRWLSTLIGLKWILRGKEYLEKEQACIVVANHQSSLDILGMFDFWHIMDKCTVVAKKELLYAWPFGLAAWLAGLIFIDRFHPDKAHNSMNQAAEDIRMKKIKLWVFPEGTRHNTGEIHAFKKGAFHLAITAQLPILPVVYSQYYFLDEKARRFDPGNIIVTTLPPISTEGLTLKDLDSLMERTHKIMSNTFKETSKEVLTLCG